MGHKASRRLTAPQIANRWRAPPHPTDLSVPEPPIVDDALREFLRAHLESLEQLVCLVLLHEETRAWTIEDAAARLGMRPDRIEEALDGLVARSLAARASDGFRLARADEHSVVLARLADVYGQAPIEVMKVMSAQAIERVRGGALRAFADAFMLKKKRDG